MADLEHLALASEDGLVYWSIFYYAGRLQRKQNLKHLVTPSVGLQCTRWVI